MRAEVGLPAEARRHIFVHATPAIGALAATIARPGVLIKACVPLPDLLAVLPPGWRGHPQAYFMTCDGAMRDAPALPLGYDVAIAREGAVLVASITSGATVAARGRAVPSGDLLVYDQIVTDTAHRRRGLGANIMRALEAAGDGRARRQALTATAAGHALYTALGWTTRSLYSTAEFEAREPCAA